MSRITSRPTTGSLNPFGSTVANAGQAYGPIPANAIAPTTGTGTLQPSAVTYVGQKFDTSDGRVLTFVQNGTVALVAGVAVQTAAEVTAFEKLSVPTPTTAVPATAGTYQVLVTNGSTVLNVNQFQQGYAVVAAGTGIGQTLKIASHSAAANAGVITLNLEDPIQTTLDNTSKISLIANPYIGVIINPTTQTGAIVGVTLYPIAASTAATYNGTTGALTANGVAQYGLIVTNGPTSCLIDTVTSVGYPLGASTNTAGALNVATLTHSAQVGVALQTLTTAQNGLVYLQL
jgi:hypothetical protein